MSPLQPHDPRIRYRPGAKVWLDNQAAENALGSGWSRYPQPACVAEEPMIVINTELDIDVIAGLVMPEHRAVSLVEINAGFETPFVPIPAIKRKRGRPRKVHNGDSP